MRTNKIYPCGDREHLAADATGISSAVSVPCDEYRERDTHYNQSNPNQHRRSDNHKEKHHGDQNDQRHYSTDRQPHAACAGTIIHTKTTPFKALSEKQYSESTLLFMSAQGCSVSRWAGRLFVPETPEVYRGQGYHRAHRLRESKLLREHNDAPDHRQGRLKQQHQTRTRGDGSGQ
jgi:hypothetical protein